MRLHGVRSTRLGEGFLMEGTNCLPWQTHGSSYTFCVAQVDVPLVPWANVTAHPEVDFEYAPRKFHMTCCPKDADSDNVDFTQCGPEPVAYERERPVWM